MLRNAGVCLGLPLLDAMVPAFASAQSDAPKASRFFGISLGLGLHGPNWVPENSGRDYQPSRYLEPLQDIRDDFTVISGTSHPDVNNGHSTVSSIFTACPDGSGLAHNTISLDQLMSNKLGSETRFPSLVLNTSSESEVSTSFTQSGAMIPAEGDPASLFTRLFVDSSPQEQQRQTELLRQGHSLLDVITDESKSLARQVGNADQQKLDAWFTSVRDLEKRFQRDAAWIHRPKPRVDSAPPQAAPNNHVSVAKAMFDVIKLALQTDSTRFVTLHIPAHAKVAGIQGVNQDYHDLSHHGQDGRKLEQLAIVEQAVINEWADFLRDLKEASQGGHTLLDETMVLMTSNLGNASNHNTRNMPVLFAGGGFQHGQHLAFDLQNNYPLPNLYLTALHQLGLNEDTFATSTGLMEGLA